MIDAAIIMVENAHNLWNSFGKNTAANRIMANASKQLLQRLRP